MVLERIGKEETGREEENEADISRDQQVVSETIFLSRVFRLERDSQWSKAISHGLLPSRILCT